MTQIKALIIKDLQANRKGLLIPIWYLLGSYILLGLIMIVTSATGKGNMELSGFPLDWFQNAEVHRMLSFAMQIAIFYSFFGLVFAISVAVISSTMLNQDIKLKCELFHRSQPVSIWQITCSRYIAGVGGPLALAFIVGILNMLVSIILASILSPLHVNLWMSINGFLLSWLHFAVALMVLGSILFVFSAIFRENAFGLGFCSLGVLQVLAYVLNKIYGWNVPYILSKLYQFVMSGIFKVQAAIPSPRQFGIITFSQDGSKPDLSTFYIPANFLPDLWATLFTWEIGFKLIFSCVMFILATLIYQRRDVQF